MGDLAASLGVGNRLVAARAAAEESVQTTSVVAPMAAAVATLGDCTTRRLVGLAGASQVEAEHFACLEAMAGNSATSVEAALAGKVANLMTVSATLGPWCCH